MLAENACERRTSGREELEISQFHSAGCETCTCSAARDILIFLLAAFLLWSGRKAFAGFLN
ncbi:MAG: hypothetical protein HC767_14355 [Akkermansiaceae bacterium]|nr:hypothetical protein [Akkermansiaceae bacterium]